MGRKRLMTVLAGVIAAVGLHVAPATALELGLPGVGDVKVEVSDGLKVEADLDAGIDGVLKVDPKVEAEVSESPKLKITDGALVGDTKIDAGEATKPIQDAINGASSPEPAPESNSGGSTGSTGSTGGSSGTSTAPAPSSDGADEVQTAGSAGPVLSPQQAAKLDAFRAMRDADAATLGSADFGGDVIAGVELAPRSLSSDEAPEVAPGVEIAAPSVASEDAPVAAQLATTPFGGALPDVPIALQLLAGTLVAGTALAWHLARRELSGAPITPISSR